LAPPGEIALQVLEPSADVGAMLRRAALMIVLSAVFLSGCGSSEHDDFVKSANSVCFAMNGMLQSQRPATTAAESRDALARLVGSMRHYKRQFERIEPPAADAESYRELLHQMGFVVAGLERTRLAVVAAKPAAAAKGQDEFMQAALKVDRLAGRLGIDQCATS
jgi:hypothetical protein